MLLEGQFIKMKWNIKNKSHYVKMGYHFTNYGDEFTIRAEDLSPCSKIKVKVKCDYCGEIYTISNYAYNRSTHKDSKLPNVCSKCRGKRILDTTRDFRKEKFFNNIRKICSEKGYRIIEDECKYITNFNDSIVAIECPLHGKQIFSYRTFFVNHNCPLCAKQKQIEAVSYSKDEVEKYINSINGNVLLNKEDYDSALTINLRIKCGECGSVYVTSFNSYKKGFIRCSHCSNKESRCEYKTRKLLEKYNIDYEKEKRFEDCVYKKPLPFDFYIPSFNCAIELDGQQHYDDYYYRTKTKDPDPEQRLNECKIRDKIKTDYCISKGIKLIRIPYWEEKNIPYIIKENFCVEDIV